MQSHLVVRLVLPENRQEGETLSVAVLAGSRDVLRVLTYRMATMATLVTSGKFCSAVRRCRYLAC